jgi:hypothetical protein
MAWAAMRATRRGWREAFLTYSPSFTSPRRRLYQSFGHPPRQVRPAEGHCYWYENARRINSSRSTTRFSSAPVGLKSLQVPSDMRRGPPERRARELSLLPFGGACGSPFPPCPDGRRRGGKAPAFSRILRTPRNVGASARAQCPSQPKRAPARGLFTFYRRRYSPFLTPYACNGKP